MAEREKHRLIMELMSIAHSYAALEWHNTLLGEAHQIITGPVTLLKS